jgi:hypothetical protein
MHTNLTHSAGRSATRRQRARTAAILAVAAVTALVAVRPVVAASPLRLFPVGDFVSGTLSTTSNRGGPLYREVELAPGQTAVRTITIRNVGSLAGRYTLHGSTCGSTRLARALQLVVTTGDTVVYEGTLDRLDAVTVGTLGARGRPTARTFAFHVSLAEAGLTARPSVGRPSRRPRLPRARDSRPRRARIPRQAHLCRQPRSLRQP